MRRPSRQPATSATAQDSTISAALHLFTWSPSSSGNPQYQIELVVRSAARPAWNAYVAHQPSELASSTGRLIAAHTPPVPATTRAAPR